MKLWNRLREFFDDFGHDYPAFKFIKCVCGLWTLAQCVREKLDLFGPYLNPPPPSPPGYRPVYTTIYSIPGSGSHIPLFTAFQGHICHSLQHSRVTYTTLYSIPGSYMYISLFTAFQGHIYHSTAFQGHIYHSLQHSRVTYTTLYSIPGSHIAFLICVLM